MFPDLKQEEGGSGLQPRLLASGTSGGPRLGGSPQGWVGPEKSDRVS